MIALSSKSSNHQKHLDQHCTECGLNSSTYKSISIKINSYPIYLGQLKIKMKMTITMTIGLSIDDNRDHHLDAVSFTDVVDVYADVNEVYVYVNSDFMLFLFILLLFFVYIYYSYSFVSIFLVPDTEIDQPTNKPFNRRTNNTDVVWCFLFSLLYSFLLTLLLLHLFFIIWSMIAVRVWYWSNYERHHIIFTYQSDGCGSGPVAAKEFNKHHNHNCDHDYNRYHNNNNKNNIFKYN